MNVFILDEDIDICARYHCDQHVGKMVLESTQILCTALNKKGFTIPYRSTHVKHPSVLWAEQSLENFRWLARLAHALNTEFCWRFNREKPHASIRVLEEIEGAVFPARGLTPFPQAMPDIFKVPGDPVAAYRAFYLGEKSRFAKWTRREVPEWYEQGLAEAG